MAKKLIYSTMDHPAAPLRTQSEVAQILGVSRSTVYLEEQRALDKIGRALLGLNGATHFERGTHMDSTAKVGSVSVSRRMILGSQH